MISAKQLASLIENLLNVSKVERNAFSVTTQSVKWTDIVTKSVEDNKLTAAQKQIDLTLQLPTENVPNVTADPIRIVEVINNLISNAINYTANNGKIEVSVSVGNGEVITAVKDTGKGIPKDALDHLFTKFFRVQGALDTSSNSKGTGLGLYLSKSIVDLHHGRIWVESEVGKGSTFYFSLPTARIENNSPINIPGLSPIIN
jgi:two-component system phosphate regulon sensor histidine kinase PhoR